MRKFVSGIAAMVALSGSLGVLGATQAVAQPQAAQAAQAVQAADCVKLVDTYTKRFNRYVKVKNSCARTACFSVTVAARRDPEFSIGRNKTQSFAYGGVLWTEASGVKNIDC
ncbi:hypothetical protein ACK389_30765 [Streptomyces antibioticus]|uniref:Beta-Ig-H3/fasciclin n=2 Tax=Streptomyces antibioticus TaxID=1890 RepID=A0ABX3LCR5_STRAT|nr:hypothetical protein [Streptomyces antibioticus]OOQ48536.1 hypothetical protein AFM16_26305 [Streptomyces antibioticus]